MKIQVAKRDLEKGLQMVQSGQGSNGSDITTHFLFRRVEDKIEVLTYNGCVFACAPLIGTTIEGDESFTIEGKRLKLWLAATSDAAVLTINLIHDKGEPKVKITAGKGTGTFRSLNPSVFPYWDDTQKAAKVVTTIPAARLHAALDHVRNFVSDDDKRAPELCVAEVSGGMLRASDRVSASLVQVIGLETSNMRVHARDMSGILSFLSQVGTGDLEILEHESMLILKRVSDGAVYGETRFSAALPTIHIDRDVVDPYYLTVDKAELESAVKRLTATASFENTRVTVQWAGAGNPLVLTMPSSSSDVDDALVDVLATVVADDAPALPEAGFAVAHRTLSKALATSDLDKVIIGINRMPKGGYMRFREEREGDGYLTLVAWLR